MATDLNASFNEQYMNITTKMKKRFMRKPNVSEASNEFIALAIQCEHSEQPAFAGQAYIGAAKCEASAGNFLGEAEHNLSAARQFMKAEKKLKALKFHSPDRENLEAAIGCFIQALHKYPDKSPLRTSILMELANDLVSLNHKMEAIAYYEQALDNVTDDTRRLMFLRNLLNLQIDCGKYEIAFETANTIADTYQNAPRDIVSEIQVDRILLTLVVKPSEESKPESLKSLFTDLMNDAENDAAVFNPDLSLKLQSIILCCTTNDLQSLLRVSADMKQFLNIHQIELLQKLASDERLGL